MKAALGTLFRHGLGAGGGFFAGMLVNDYGFSEETLIQLLETTEGILSSVAIFTAAMLSFLKNRKVKKQIEKVEQKETTYNE
jgi:hypothetical protein